VHQAAEQAHFIDADRPSIGFVQHEGKSGFGFCSAKLRYYQWPALFILPI
jgi:hypothetical protein